MKSEKLLVADIGGTNARFALALARGGELTIGPVTALHTAAYATLDDALEAFLETEGHPDLGAAALCAAGPVSGAGATAHIRLTNCPWEVSVEALARATAVARPCLMNDFAALALAVPALASADRHPIGRAREPLSGAPIAIVGSGTGLGVSALVFDGPQAIAVAGEGGHVDLAPANAHEAAVLAHLQARFGHVSAERVLSGPGLVTLHATLAALYGAPADPLTPEEIAARAHSNTCALARETVALFCGWLGAVAGDMALTFGARGGVYVAGGIVPGWIAAMPGLFDEDLFRARFEAKGRLEDWMKEIPAFVVTRPDAALLGLARAARAAL